MEKFSRIVENAKDYTKVYPRDSLDLVVKHLVTSREYSNFAEHIRKHLNNDIIDKEFYSEFKAVDNFKDFEELLIKYGVYDVAKGHVYFHIRVLEDFVKTLSTTGDYMKQINER